LSLASTSSTPPSSFPYSSSSATLAIPPSTSSTESDPPLLSGTYLEHTPVSHTPSVLCSNCFITYSATELGCSMLQFSLLSPLYLQSREEAWLSGRSMAVFLAYNVNTAPTTARLKDPLSWVFALCTTSPPPLQSPSLSSWLLMAIKLFINANNMGVRLAQL
jgi:hypothetical protein